MEDYLKHIEIFHKDYLYSLTNKEKYVKCKQCENKKQFIIDDNHMIYNCGAEGSGVCGDQFKINIPDYIHYEKIMKAFQSTIHGSFNYNSDIYDLSEYDLNILSKHLSLTEENNEYQETKQTILKDSERLTSFFVSSNKLKEYYDQLSTFNNEYQKNMTKKKKILYDLENDITLSLEDKIRTRKEYAKIIKNEMNEKYPMYESFINTQLNHYLLLNPEEKYVEKYQTRYLDQKTPKKKTKSPKKPSEKSSKKSKKSGKPKEKDKEENELIDIIFAHFKENNGIMTEMEYNKIKGKYKTKWGGRLFSSLRYIPGDKITNPWKKKEQEKYGPIIEERDKNSKEIKLTTDWMEYLDIEEKKPKGLGDQLEELQVDIMKGVSKAEEEQKKKNLQ